VGLNSKAPLKDSQTVIEAPHSHHMIEDVGIFCLVLHDDLNVSED
jgi:hypothetical protein